MPFLSWRLLFEEDGSLSSEEVIVKNGEKVGFGCFEIFKERSILISKLIGKFVSQLLFAAIHIDILATFEPDNRFSNSLNDSCFKFFAFCLEISITFFKKEIVDDLSPDLIYFLCVLVEQFLVKGHFFPF
jgi:hypothetical protein